MAHIVVVGNAFLALLDNASATGAPPYMITSTGNLSPVSWVRSTRSVTTDGTLLCVDEYAPFYKSVAQRTRQGGLHSLS